MQSEVCEAQGKTVLFQCLAFLKKAQVLKNKIFENL